MQHRFILINFLLFSAAVQFCKGRYTNTSFWLWLIVIVIKTSWNGYVSISSSTGKVSWKRTELNLWIKTLIRWNKNCTSSGSPVRSEILWPIIIIIIISAKEVTIHRRVSVCVCLSVCFIANSRNNYILIGSTWTRHQRCIFGPGWYHHIFEFIRIWFVTIRKQKKTLNFAAMLIV